MYCIAFQGFENFFKEHTEHKYILLCGFCLTTVHRNMEYSHLNLFYLLFVLYAA